MNSNTAIFWFRRDLRLTDNQGLSAASAQHSEVQCVFVFDTTILDNLPRTDRRVDFIWQAVQSLKNNLRQLGSDLVILVGDPVEVIPEYAQHNQARAVYTNKDYEPQAILRDQAVADSLHQKSISFTAVKDQVIFEAGEILTQNGTPYTVFTHYKKAWRKRWQSASPVIPQYQKLRLKRLTPDSPMPSLSDLGFQSTDLTTLGIIPNEQGAQLAFQDFITRWENYHTLRNYPAVRGVSYLSVHLRFGTISIRTLAQQAADTPHTGAQTWLDELIWRDFYFAILAHFPHVTKRSFNQKWDNLEFTENQTFLKAWETGHTGYPIVDAAQRQLNQTGYMHNRLRMISASFLVKDLEIDWRCGETYFAQKLLDFDLAANNGGWQWSASTGCDAQPWFRLFNPVLQSQKFDPDGQFIKQFIPELKQVPAPFIHTPWELGPLKQKEYNCFPGINYPHPLVDHATARIKTLHRYQKVSS